MNTQTEKDWHYLDVSRGAYLCSEHGGFCHPSDGNVDRCIACDSEDSNKYSTNPIHRYLRIINGLQGRSKRNLSLLSALVGGIGIIRLIPSDDKFIRTFSSTSVLLTMALLSGAVAFYAASMSHIPVTENDDLQKKKLHQWEKLFILNLAKMEKNHRRAGILFVTGISIFALTLFWAFLQNTLPPETISKVFLYFSDLTSTKKSSGI